jgi:hypothetical protein
MGQIERNRRDAILISELRGKLIRIGRNRRGLEMVGLFVQPDFETVELQFDNLMARFGEIQFREAPCGNRDKH